MMNQILTGHINKHQYIKLYGLNLNMSQINLPHKLNFIICFSLYNKILQTI